MGPISVIREFYFGDVPKEMVEFLDAALMIGMEVRVSNEVDSDGVIDWRLNCAPRRIRPGQHRTTQLAAPRRAAVDQGLDLT
jgi:hypothetical protein